MPREFRVTKADDGVRHVLTIPKKIDGSNINRAAAVSANPEDKVKPNDGDTAQPEFLQMQEGVRENFDPYRRRVHTQPPRNKVRRFFWQLFQQPEPTAEERAIMEEKHRRLALEQLLRDEAVLFQDRIINRLTGRELCYRYKKSEKDWLTSGVQKVKFDRIVMQPDALYFHVDTLHLPRGIGILDLMDEAVLTDLSIACQHRVSADYSEKHGAWYIIERASGVLGIPNHVKYQDVMLQMPAYADGLTIPLGLTSNGKPVYKSLSQMYSLLVGGTIGAGKSNILNVILCTLIRRNGYTRLRLLLIDLKGGLEFTAYEKIPHLLSIPGTVDDKGEPVEVAPGGIAYKREQVPRVLNWLYWEGERRITIIKKAGYRDIGRYNNFQRKKSLAHIVLVIDEWADVKLDHKIGQSAEDLLTNIAQRYRAVGIHVILCTQIPKSETVSTRIKGVLPAKMAFSTPTNQSSMAILDNGHAKGLEPAGRCVYQFGNEIIVQTPYINEKIISETVQGAISGKFEVINQGHDVTPTEIQTWALENDNGNLSTRRLFEVFGKRGLTRLELEEWLKSWEGENIVIGSSVYRVESGSGNRPRRMIAADTENGGESSDKSS